jgi:2,4-dichlorophenol 6-monooxygenase
MSEARVLIVGGGPVGLTAALRLAQEGVPSRVVERRPAVGRAPAAHVLRARPMAVFERLGVAAEIERAKPALALDAITWCATLGGREVGRLDLRKGVRPGRDVWTNCPQNVLEPILRRAVEREDRIELRTGAECVGIEPVADGVRAMIRDADGSEETLESAWAIAADGAASSIRRMLDVAMVGPGPQGSFFMVHFEADLRPWIEGRSGPIFWILNPEAPGALIVHDPARSHVWMTLQSGVADEEETIPGRLARSLGIPTWPRILAIDAWAPHVQVAERYREGRVFLAGDAAHRFPPTGGLGLNTGILDVDVLAGLLGEVERARADPARLDAYETTCRPVAEANARESLANALRLGEVAEVLGPCADLPALEKRLDTLTRAERARLEAAIEHQRSHFVSDGCLPSAIGASVEA